MSTATVTPKEVTSATSLLVESVRIYLQVKNAFEQCDEEIQAVVVDMIDIANSDDATPDERQRALYTMVEAIFPALAVDFLDTCDKVRGTKEATANWDRMAAEEASFAEQLSHWMAKKEMTQEQLATKIGVGQSAIANLLNRNCRPQRKTVVRLADALGIAPQELWPNIKLD